MNVNNIYLLDHQQISAAAGSVYRNMNTSQAAAVMQMKAGLQSDPNADKVIFKVESDHLVSAAAAAASATTYKMNAVNGHSQLSTLAAASPAANGPPKPKATESDQHDKAKPDPMDMSVPNSLNIYVNNVVCSYSTRCHLNLRRIAMEGMHVEYKKENGVSSFTYQAELWSTLLYILFIFNNNNNNNNLFHRW
jgi:hypothetical protein